MKTHNKWEISYYWFFIIRRIMYVAIAFELFDRDWQHVIAMNFLNTAWILYLGGNWPH